METVERLLAELISIPSVNPTCDPEGSGEGEIARFLADRLRRAGLDVELREVEPGRPNLLAILTPRAARGRVVLAPHLDTVTVRGMTIAPFDPVVREGRMFGRGAADTKGSVAACVAAIETLAAGPAFVRGEGPEVVFAGLMGEESGNDGAEALLNAGFRADFAVVGEPTRLEIVCRHRGVLWTRIVTEGVAAHGSTPEKGRSALWPMTRILDELRDRLIPSLEEGATINVGVIRGGTQVNIVPDRCEIEIDWRIPPGGDPRDCLDRLEAAAAEAAGDGAGRVEEMRVRGALNTDPAHPRVAALAEAIRAAGGEGKIASAPWFCDASVFSEHGIPAVAFGPGESAQAHTAEESVLLGEVRRAAAILERFLAGPG